MQFNFQRLSIPDVILIEPKVFNDERGFFMETYKYPDFAEFGIKEHFTQDSHSKSVKKGILRGLHYQINPFAQEKIIRITSGEVFDVVLDIRKGSPHYGKWISVVLSSENKKMLYVPSGFAHGFCTLSETVDLLYKFTNVYSPKYERGIFWNDPEIGINWPVKEPIVSQRDSGFPVLERADNNFVYP